MFARALAISVILASCYNLPAWEGDIDVRPIEREAIARCGTGALTPAGRQRIARHPYLQSTTPTSTNIVWGTKGAGGGEVILRSPDGDVVARARASVAAPRVVTVKFATLEPGRLYCYQLVDGELALTEPAPLATAAPPGRTGEDPIRFVALGDTGTGSRAQRAIAKRLGAHAFDLMLFLGDIAYEEGTKAQLDDMFFDVYRAYLRYAPAYTVIGNHERETKNGRPYFDAFVLPGTERYYSFDWGDVHFVALDTTERDPAQVAWLQADLAGNALPWVVVFMHHPMYTSSVRTAAALSVRRMFEDTFRAHGVDVVLSGHEHHYERFERGGVSYIVSGGGGARLMYFWGNLRAKRQATVHHFLAFEVTATTLEMTAIDIAGTTIDTLRLVQPGAVSTR